MANLFKDYRESAANNRVPVNLFTFLFFSFMWSLGAVCGVLLCILGVGVKDELETEQEEIDRMIARMNEEGPNN